MTVYTCLRSAAGHLVLEEIELRWLGSGQSDKRETFAYLEVSIFVRSVRTAEVRILFPLILPVITRHAKLLQEDRFAKLGGPFAGVCDEADDEILRFL